MATKVVMEALSPTMEEGRLVEWKKGEGEAVAVGDVLAEVETDKAVMELVARAGGTLLKQVVPAGTTVPVSQLVALDRRAGRAGGGRGKRPGRRRQGGTGRPGRTPATPPRTGSLHDPPGATLPPPRPPRPRRRQRQVSGSRPRRSPAGSRPSAGSTWARCTGSGPEGRVVLRDLEGAGAVATTAAGAPRPVVRTGGGPAYTDVPLTQIRKTIAKRLVQSIGPVPDVLPHDRRGYGARLGRP